MKFSRKLLGKAVVISIVGEVTSMYDSKELIDTINHELDKGNKYIIINLAEVNYIDSSGINVFISALTSVRNHEGELVLTSLSNKVKSLLVITKLNSIFKVQNSVDDALQFISETETLSNQYK